MWPIIRTELKGCAETYDNIAEYRKEDMLSDKISVLEKYNTTYNINEFDQLMKSNFLKNVVSTSFLNSGEILDTMPVFPQDVLSTFVARLTKQIKDADLSLLSTVNAKMGQTTKDFVDIYRCTETLMLTYVQSWNTKNIDNVFIFFRISIDRLCLVKQDNKISKKVRNILANQLENKEMLASLEKIALIKHRLDRRFDVILSLFTYCWLSVVVQLIIASKSQSPRIQKKMAAYLHSYFLAEVRRKNKIDR
jgi:hypothetical protein